LRSERCWWVTSPGDGVGGDGVGERIVFITITRSGFVGEIRIVHQTSGTVRDRSCIRAVRATVEIGVIVRRIIGLPIGQGRATVVHLTDPTINQGTDLLEVGRQRSRLKPADQPSRSLSPAHRKRRVRLGRPQNHLCLAHRNHQTQVGRRRMVQIDLRQPDLRPLNRKRRLQLAGRNQKPEQRHRISLPRRSPRVSQSQQIRLALGRRKIRLRNQQRQQDHSPQPNKKGPQNRGLHQNHNRSSNRGRQVNGRRLRRKEFAFREHGEN
jgi:hypothetical protein